MTELMAETLNKVNEYIKANFQEVHIPYVRIIKRNSGEVRTCANEWMLKLSASPVYRHNNESEDTSIDVQVRGVLGWNDHIWGEKVRFRVDQKWNTIAKKLDKVIAAANNVNEKFNLPMHDIYDDAKAIYYYNKEEGIRALSKVTPMYDDAYKTFKEIEKYFG